jgi:hypothetical protein
MINWICQRACQIGEKLARRIFKRLEITVSRIISTGVVSSLQSG